jgi:hypothetical protein
VAVGATLLNLTLTPLFLWDVLAPSFASALGTTPAGLSVVISVGLGCFTLGVLGGGWLADRLAPRLLALLATLGVATGLLLSSVATGAGLLLVCFGVLVGACSGLAYAVSVRVAAALLVSPAVVALVVAAYAAATLALAPVLAAVSGGVGALRWLGGGVLACGVAAAVLLRAAARTPRRPAATVGAPQRHTVALRGRRAVVSLWLVFGLGSAPGLGAFAHASALAGVGGGLGVALAVLSAGNLLGRVLAGLPVLGGAAASGLRRAALLNVAGGVLVLVAPGTPAALVGMLGLGLGYGALAVVVPLATRQVAAPSRYGAVYGAVFTSWGVAGFLMPVALGAGGAPGLAGRVLTLAVAGGAAVVAWGFTASARDPSSER